VAFALATWFGADRYQVPGDELVSTLLFARTYLPSDVSIWAEQWPIGHFWSLNVEEHSYIVLAALAYAARRAGGRAQLALLVAATLLCLFFNGYYTLIPPAGASPWFARSECAALGLVAAATLRVFRHRAGAPVPTAAAAWVTPAAVVLAAVCFTWPAYPILQITLGPLLLAVAVNYLDCAPALLHRGLSLRPLRWFGICSFSLYIWQQPFYDAYLHGNLQRQVAGVLALIVASVAFYLYEDPVRRRLNNGSRRAVNALPVQAERGLP
jgi:peptidoglycan/LPS O-acetylase OafA/YrhL